MGKEIRVGDKIKQKWFCVVCIVVFIYRIRKRDFEWDMLE